MPKFFSTVVFLFGGLMMVVVAISMVQRYLPWEGPSAGEVTVVPPTDLPPLDLGTQEEFHKTLDRVYNEGGLTMVQQWVASQLVPGRILLIGEGNPTPATSSRMALIDREMRLCGRSGAILPSHAALVSRATPEVKLAQTLVSVSWSRLDAPTPYTLTTWGLPTPVAP
ncbi:hypothetical protein [Verrucomicrobium sp. BvORR106]|uniref:hypothetical protein n=1 Tax=Verrucomicrobium sp. BvORR106 TaxID=1403819 RepID=UPI0005719DBD|nr:hypothetical protein [Verrucomicrobium sp. BvORR106]